MKVLQSFLWVTFFLLVYTPVLKAAPAEEEETRFKAVALSGSVTVYHDERDETVRMRKGDKTDDGDNVFTGAKSEVLLRLPGKGLVHLGPHTQLHISRLRNGDKGLQVRLNLLAGDLWCQLDENPKYLFEVSAKGLIARCHGTLFETIRQKDAVRITVYEGPVVTVAHAIVKIAKSGEVVQYIQDRFRYKHRVKTSDEEHLAQWKAHLAALQGEKPVKTP
jgi:hypothetical protein